MTEVNINSTYGSLDEEGKRHIVSAGGDVQYIFYSISTDDEIAFKKSTDNGATWGSETTVISETAGNGIRQFSVWFDKWTPGDTGGIIHVLGMNTSTEKIYYNNVDTSDDSVGTKVTVWTATSIDDDTRLMTDLNIVKAKSGALYAMFKDNQSGSLETGHKKSTDGGATWGSDLSDPYDGADDICVLFPGNLADDDDYCCIYLDYSAGELSVKVYDETANSWTETSIDASITTNTIIGTSGVWFAGAQRHSDEHIIVAYQNAWDSATGDLKCVDITVTSTTASVTAKTDVVSNTDDLGYPAVAIDQSNDDIYVYYIGDSDGADTIGSSVDVFYKKSTDGGSTWGTQSSALNTTKDDFRAMFVDPGNADTSYNILPVWWNDDTDQHVTDSANAISVTISSGFTGTIASKTQSIVSGGNFSGSQEYIGTIVSKTQSVISNGNLAGSQKYLGDILSVIPSVVSDSIVGVMQPSGVIVSTAQSIVSNGNFAGSVAEFVGNITSTTQSIVSDSITGTQTIPGSIVSITQVPTSSFAGVMQPSGAIVSSLQDVVSSLAGSQIFSGAIVSITQVPVSSFAGSQAISGDILSVVQVPTSALAGLQTYTGTITSTMQVIVSGSITGSQIYEGAIVSIIQVPTFGGAAILVIRHGSPRFIRPGIRQIIGYAPMIGTGVRRIVGRSPAIGVGVRRF